MVEAEVRRRTGVHINMHLNPTYVAGSTPIEAAFKQGKYEPPYLRDVAEAALRAQNSGLSIFLGLSDEGLAVPGGSFLRPGEEKLIEQLETL